MTCIVANVGKHELLLPFSVVCAYFAKVFGSIGWISLRGEKRLTVTSSSLKT